jgi:hypothetical protein
MAIPSFPSIETLKKWFDYWRKFKGKRVRIWLRRGWKLTKSIPIHAGNSIEMDFLDEIIGTISEVIESPFGIMLKDISSEVVEMTFIPMSEISKMDFLKRKQES